MTKIALDFAFVIYITQLDFKLSTIQICVVNNLYVVNKCSCQQ